VSITINFPDLSVSAPYPDRQHSPRITVVGSDQVIGKMFLPWAAALNKDGDF